MTPNLTKEILPFDFRNQYFLTHSSLQLIHDIHLKFAELATEAFSDLLSDTPKISLIEVQQVPFSLFLKGCSAASFNTLIDLNPLQGQGIISLNLDLCYGIIEEFLGGGQKKTHFKAFNELEIAIQRKFIKLLLSSLKIAWKNYFEMEFNIADLSVNLKSQNTISRQAKCVVIDFSYQFYYLFTLFTIVIPAQSLQGFENIIRHHNFSNPSTVNMNSIHMEMKTKIGSVELNASDLTSLQAHDIIKLDANINKPLSVLVEGYPVLKALPGLLNKQKAIELL